MHLFSYLQLSWHCIGLQNRIEGKDPESKVNPYTSLVHALITCIHWVISGVTMEEQIVVITALTILPPPPHAINENKEMTNGDTRRC